MLVIIGIMLLGIIAGRLSGHRAAGILPRVTTVLVWVLLFILGAEAGSNRDIVNEFAHLGAEAFIITAGAMAGSIGCAWMLWRTAGRNKNKEAE